MTLGVAVILTAGSWLRWVRLPSQEAAESSTPPSQLLGTDPSCPQPAAPPNRAPPPPAWTTGSCCLTEQAEVTGGRGLSSEHLGRSRWAVPTMTWPPHHPPYRWGSPPSFLAFLCICLWTFTHGGDFPTSLQLPCHPHTTSHSAASPGLPSSLTLSWGPWAHSRPPAPGPPPHWVLSGTCISLASQATNPNQEPWSAAPLSRPLTYPSSLPSPPFDDMTTTPQLLLREQKPQQLKSGSPWTEPLPPGHTQLGPPLVQEGEDERCKPGCLLPGEDSRIPGGRGGESQGQGRGTCRWVGSRPPTPTGAWIPRGLCKQLCKHPPKPRQPAEHSERTPFAGRPCPGTRSLSTLPLLLQRSRSGKMLQNSKLNSKHIEACPGLKAFKHNRKMLANHESGIWWVSGITEV